MVDQITFREDDNLRWGPGQGADLSAVQIDINFWVLLTAIQALQAESNDHAGIDHFVIVGQNLFVHLTNHFVLGPYELPMAQWNFVGEWVPRTAYQVFDVVTHQRAVYLVLLQHVSNSLFSAGAQLGGQNEYGLLLSAPTPELPQTGTKGAFLQWQNSPSDVRWFQASRNIAFYLEAAPDPNEYVLQYQFTETITFPVNLGGSQFGTGVRPTGNQEFDLFQDGGPIGTVIFHAVGSPTVTFHHPITFTAGEVLTVIGPTVPDSHMGLIRFSLVGLID